MREIKFRLWDDKDKKWLLGYEYENLGGFSMFGEVMAFGEYTRVLNHFSLDDWDRLVLMQFTGLHDKNGKEIYEGDIVMFWGGIGKVIYFDAYASFKIQYTENDMADLNLNSHEILGNIYENPELLNQ